MFKRTDLAQGTDVDLPDRWASIARFKFGWVGRSTPGHGLAERPQSFGAAGISFNGSPGREPDPLRPTRPLGLGQQR